MKGKRQSWGAAEAHTHARTRARGQKQWHRRVWMCTQRLHTDKHTHILHVRLLELTYNQRLWARVKAGGSVCWGGWGFARWHVPPVPVYTPGEPKVSIPPGTCRSSVLGAVIFLPTTNLMTEARGLITATPPPPPTHPPPPPAAPRSFRPPLSYPGVCQRGVCSATGGKQPAASLPRTHGLGLSLSFWSGAGRALHQPGPSACSLRHCLASEKDYYFNSIYCE